MRSQNVQNLKTYLLFHCSSEINVLNVFIARTMSTAIGLVVMWNVISLAVGGIADFWIVSPDRRGNRHFDFVLAQTNGNITLTAKQNVHNKT